MIIIDEEQRYSKTLSALGFYLDFTYYITVSHWMMKVPNAKHPQPIAYSHLLEKLHTDKF